MLKPLLLPSLFRAFLDDPLPGLLPSRLPLELLFLFAYPSLGTPCGDKGSLGTFVVCPEVVDCPLLVAWLVVCPELVVCKEVVDWEGDKLD